MPPVEYFNIFFSQLKKLFVSPTSFVLLIIIGLSIFLRFWNLGDTPLWYSDEGANINIAWNLAHGKMEFEATTYTFVAHPPLFYLLSGFAMRLFGYNLLVARSLPALYGVLSVIIVYFAAKELSNKYAGLTAAFLFAIFPLAVLYNRWDFDYNLLQLLSITVFYMCIKYVKSKNNKWFYAAAATAGLAVTANLLGVSLLVGLFVFLFIRKDFKMILKAALFALPAIAAYIISMLATQPRVFLYSIVSVFSRKTTSASSVSLLDGVTAFLKNIETVSLLTPWITVGIIGFFVFAVYFILKKQSLKRDISIYTITFFVTFFLVTTYLFNVSGPHIRGIIHVFPFCAIGVALLAFTCYHFISTQITVKVEKKISRHKAPIVAFLLWLSVFSSATILLSGPVYYDVQSVMNGYETRLDSFCIKNSADAYVVTDFLNSNTRSDDYVIASGQISWLIKCKTATLGQVAAIEHKSISFYPTDMPEEMFIFNCSYPHAKFFVVDDFSKHWYFSAVNLKPALRDMQANWTRVFEVGEFIVYQNPNPT